MEIYSGKNILYIKEIELQYLQHIPPEYLILFIAAQRMGAILVPLNYRSSVSELQYCVNDVEPKLFISEDAFWPKAGKLLEYDSAEIPLLENIFEEAVKFEPKAEVLEIEPDQPVFIFYTSGTTGKPKGVLYTNRMLFWNSLNTSVQLEITSKDFTLNTLPPYHTSGWNVLLLPMLHRGARVDFIKAFKSKKVLNYIEKNSITKTLFLRSEKAINQYLTVAIVCMSVFFLVVVVGLYARLTFPDLSIDGVPLKMDELVSAYVVKTFSAGVGVIIVAGLISAGLSTLEALIQSLSTTITTDLISPFSGKENFNQVGMNKIVIIILAIVSFYLSYDQIIDPNVSVAIFAQNGVYAYFAAAFVPVLFGIYFKKVSKNAVFIASFSAVAIHFIIYYGRITPYMQEPVNNPGVSAAIAVIASFIIGNSLYLFRRKRA